jgi:hypothetical protein
MLQLACQEEGPQGFGYQAVAFGRGVVYVGQERCQVFVLADLFPENFKTVRKAHAVCIGKGAYGGGVFFKPLPAFIMGEIRAIPGRRKETFLG